MPQQNLARVNTTALAIEANRQDMYLIPSSEATRTKGLTMRIAVCCLTALLYLGVSATLAATGEPINDDQKTFYALGVAISQSLNAFNLRESELEFVKAGLTDGVLKRRHKVDIQAFGPKIQQLQQVRAAAVAEV